MQYEAQLLRGFRLHYLEFARPTSVPAADWPAVPQKLQCSYACAQLSSRCRSDHQFCSQGSREKSFLPPLIWDGEGWL